MNCPQAYILELASMNTCADASWDILSSTCRANKYLQQMNWKKQKSAREKENKPESSKSKPYHMNTRIKRYQTWREICPT